MKHIFQGPYEPIRYTGHAMYTRTLPYLDSLLSSCQHGFHEISDMGRMLLWFAPEGLIGYRHLMDSNSGKVRFLENNLILITSHLDKNWQKLWTRNMKFSSVTGYKRHMHRLYMNHFCAYKHCSSMKPWINIWHLSKDSTEKCTNLDRKVTVQLLCSGFWCQAVWLDWSQHSSGRYASNLNYPKQI
jgi:hypothetical protein